MPSAGFSIGNNGGSDAHIESIIARESSSIAVAALQTIASRVRQRSDSRRLSRKNSLNAGTCAREALKCNGFGGSESSLLGQFFSFRGQVFATAARTRVVAARERNDSACLGAATESDFGASRETFAVRDCRSLRLQRSRCRLRAAELRLTQPPFPRPVRPGIEPFDGGLFHVARRLSRRIFLSPSAQPRTCRRHPAQPFIQGLRGLEEEA